MWVNRFAVQVTLRLAAMFATLLVLTYLIAATRLVAVTALVGVAGVVQAWMVVQYIHRTNRELGRLLDAIRYDDFQQSFSIERLGTSFADLKTAFDDVMQRFRAARLDREAQRRYLEALVEQVPVAILAVHDDGQVE